jgi:hypothetical protein
MVRKPATPAATKLKKALPTVAEAQQRLMTQAAIDLYDLSVLMNVSLSTTQRAAARGDLPVRMTRLGQRYVIPAVGVRELLGLAEGAA